MTGLRTCTTTFLFALLIAGTAIAGPPLITDDAGTVEVGTVEVELNGSSPYDKETNAGVTTKNNTTDAEMKLTTGLYRNLGISLAIPYTVSARVKENDQQTVKTDGLGDMSVELKCALAEFTGVTVAIKPSVILPTGNYSSGLSEGRWQFGATLIATREFAEGKYALHTNLGYEHHSYRSDVVKDSARSNIWSGSIAGEGKLMDGFLVVVDFGLASNPDTGSNELPVYALTGVSYEMNSHLGINAGVKLGLTKPEEDISILYGMVLKF